MASDGWPTLGWEEHPWRSTIDPDLLPRATRSRVSQCYRSALVPDIANITLELPAEAAALDAEATAAIARFDADAGHEIAPFAALLLRSESASSSMIENLTSGAKAIALAEMGATDKRNARAVVANVAAMNAAIALADRLDADAMLAMHRALMAHLDPPSAGQWRQEQVWIGGDSISPHQAAFVPPHHDHVPRLIADLVRFTRRTDLPVLSQAAIAHAQFETIHPFTDGNGRTGRALIHALLHGHGLTRNVTVPVSAGLLTDTSGYFATLDAYRRGDPIPIITTLATASFTALRNATELVADLRRIRTGWDARVRARRGADVWRLADLLVRQPVVDTPLVARELGISPANAARPITPLTQAGVLTEFTGLARNRMWQANEVLDALDAFATRAGRRGTRDLPEQ